jgi:hypothetical protein
MIEAAVKLGRLLLGLAALELAGFGLLAGLMPGPTALSRWERAAYSFGLGALVLTLWMLALTSLGLPFSLPLILAPTLALAAAAATVGKLIGGGGQGSQTPAPSPKPSPPTPYRGLERGAKTERKFAATFGASEITENRKQKTENRLLDWLFLGLLAALFAFAFLRAALYPIWAWDALATWGCKARIFFLDRAVDLTCIDAHNYYPNLVPLLLTYLYFCLGQVNDSLVQGVFPLWGALLLALLYSFLRRLGLSRRQALGTTTFFALNGTVFIIHLYIAYADLPLAYFTLGAAGLFYLWLTGAAPRGSFPLMAVFFAAMAWCKYEGAPLAATILLAGALTLAWLRPPDLERRLLGFVWPAAGLALGYLSWRLFTIYHHIEPGTDHIMNFSARQFLEAIPMVLESLGKPQDFGLLWPAAALALILSGRRLWTSPRLFLALFLAGNCLAILLAYALAPTSAAEFPQYVNATLNRLLLHLTPVAALLVGEGVRDLGEGQGPEAPALPQTPSQPA